MSDYSLHSPTDGGTLSVLRDVFHAEDVATIAVREEVCCKDWIHIGEISLRLDPGVGRPETIGFAVSDGGFEWAFPDTKRLWSSGAKALGVTGEAGASSLRRTLEHVAFVATKIGLVAPRMDADVVADLPFRRPTTLVIDTSSIIQGGLDFAARFLYPAARIRVPAVVHMELLCQTDNYFKIRRADKKPTPAKAARALLERACGVGGQRTLLRVELHAEAEVERATIGADPLRGIIRLDEEDKSLNVERVQRSFADRLVFETAREHQSRCSPGHPVTLMTCDEGLARMTLGEGMRPLMMRSVVPSDLSAQTLTGSPFHPFTGNLFSVSLTALLWELAVTFGEARLETKAGTIEICSTAPDLGWQPFHAAQDLLWVKSDVKKPARPSAKSKREASRTSPGSKAAKSQVVRRSGSYRFNLPRMIKLIGALAGKRRLTVKEAQKVLNIGSEKQVDDYRNFLSAGGLCAVSAPNRIEAVDATDDLWRILLSDDLRALSSCLQRVPSFEDFVATLATRGKVPEGEELGVPKRAKTTYLALAEICALALAIPGEGIYYTPADMDPRPFAQIALSAYKSLVRDGTYVSTGEWLETLVRDHSIHPTQARWGLDQARIAGLLERFTEGSTPETRFEQHRFHRLVRRNGEPTIERVHLYHGDFLIEGRASVSLRLQTKESR